MNVSRRLALLGSTCLAGLRGSSQALAAPTCQSLGQESPPGAVVTGAPSTYVINASATPGTAGQGNIITITSGSQVAYNGTTATGTSAATNLAYIDHTAFWGNTSGGYFGPIISATNTGGVGTPTATPGVGSFTDPGGNVWTVTAAGVAQENGVVPANNFNVAYLYLISGVVWQVNTTPTAYYFTQTGTNVGTFTQGTLPAINTGGTAVTSPLPVILLSNTTVGANTPSGSTVGTLSVTTGLPNGTIGTGAYAWVFSVSGTTAVTVSGSSLLTNGVLPGGTFSFQVSAANAAVIGSPFGQSFSITVAGAAGKSAPGTTVTTTTGQLIASSTPGSAGTQNVITITSGAQIAVNGTTIGGANVTTLYYIDHTAFQENTSNNWYGPVTSSLTTGGGTLLSGPPQPTIVLSNSTVPPSSPVGTVVGAITVTTGLPNGTVGTGAYTWALSLSGTNANDFQIVSGNLETAVANLAASTYSVTITATNSAVVGSPFTLPTTITITAPGGAFKVSGGKILAPDGTVWIGAGVDVHDFNLGAAASAVAGQFSAPQVAGEFPGINLIRVAAPSGYGEAYPAPSSFASAVATLTALKIVVEFTDYGNSLGSGGGGSQGYIYTGSLLTAESNWYAAMATYYINNPYVWFGTNNEPSEQYPDGNYYATGPNSLAAWQYATYQAIRGTGNNNPILIEPSGTQPPGNQWRGGAGALLMGYTDPSYIALMTNVIWDPHIYSFINNNVASRSGANGTDALVAAVIAQCQTVQSKDGVMPCIVGEFGPLAENTVSDPWVASILANGVSYSAWAWDDQGSVNPPSIADVDQLMLTTNGVVGYTDYGAQVKAGIAITK